jgi:hypothetical protein
MRRFSITAAKSTAKEKISREIIENHACAIKFFEEISYH